MHNPTLIGRLFSMLFFVAAAFPAHAQQPPGNAAGGFCALKGTDLLAALDGSWTIQQGAGAAVGGNMTIPLPPSSASVSLNFDPVSGIIDIDSADLADGMIMFPTAPIQQGQANKLLGAQTAGNAAASGSSCNWSALPTLIGTNYYFAVGEEYFAQAEVINICEEMMLEDTFNTPAYQDYYDSVCAGEKLPAPFEMEMTIVLRFSDAQSGNGSILFTGKQDDVEFAASAPVEVSR